MTEMSFEAHSYYIAVRFHLVFMQFLAACGSAWVILQVLGLVV